MSVTETHTGVGIYCYPEIAGRLVGLHSCLPNQRCYCEAVIRRVKKHAAG